MNNDVYFTSTMSSLAYKFIPAEVAKQTVDDQLEKLFNDYILGVDKYISTAVFDNNYKVSFKEPHPYIEARVVLHLKNLGYKVTFSRRSSNMTVSWR